MKTIATATFFLALSGSAHAANKIAPETFNPEATSPVVLTATQLDDVTAGYSTLFSGGVFVATGDVSGSTTTTADGTSNTLLIGERPPW